jgi:hypothetical protein
MWNIQLEVLLKSMVILIFNAFQGHLTGDLQAALSEISKGIKSQLQGLHININKFLTIT